MYHPGELPVRMGLLIFALWDLVKCFLQHHVLHHVPDVGLLRLVVLFTRQFPTRVWGKANFESHPRSTPHPFPPGFCSYAPVHTPSEYQIIVQCAVPLFTILFRVSLLWGSDKGFLYYWGLTKDSFTVGVWQRIPLLLGSDKGFLYYWGQTKYFFTIGVWQRIPLLLGSDKGFLY